MNARLGRRHGRRATRFLSAICAVGLVAMIVAAGSALAAPASNSQVVPVKSNEASLGGFQLDAPIIIPDPLPIVITDLTISAKAQWKGDITTDLGWDSDKVRQGDALDVTRKASATSGAIDVKWQLSGEIDGISFGPTTIDKDNVTCEPKLSGSGFECDAQSPAFALPGALPSPIPLTFVAVKIGVGLKFEMTPEGAVVTRNFAVGGNTLAGPDDLGLTSSTQTDNLTVPCGSQAGDAVSYQLDPFHWSPTASATEQVQVRIVNTADPLGLVDLFDWHAFDVGSAIVSDPAFDLTGAGFITPMGGVLANNVKPAIDPLGPFSGQEGSAIAFGANITSKCPIDSTVWHFSDGTKSFGPSPQRAFADNGVYDGQVTATDVTGLSTTRSFSVNVSNVKPSVNAGPDTTADWGRAVQFNGQATDAGSNDQGTLQYVWSFGDGSPSATGGPAVVHSYATPGDYNASLQVCDKDGGCDTDSRIVHVTKRDTTLGYTGPLSSAPSKTVTVKATLVDEYGQPVSGKKVTFQLGTQSAVGTTDASGNASANIKLTLKPGSYVLNAVFPAGDAKYSGATDSGLTFVIGK
jgi:hypothetical protein